MNQRRRIHQVLIGAAVGDAVTGMAFALRDALRAQFESDVFALWRHGPEMERECRPLGEMPSSSDVDLLIYHLSIGNVDVHKWLMNRTEKLAISYHNVTPATHYERFNAEFAADLVLGREEIRLLQSKVILALADSQYNAAELHDAGYADVHVIPVGVTPSRLVAQPYDLSLLRQMKHRFPNGFVLAVGQVLPHKRIEQLMQTMHIMNSTHWRNIGLVIVGVQRQHHYFQTLLKYRTRCAMIDVHFAGGVSDSELATYFRGARAFFGMSDHEGFCIPPFEAFSFGVPVVIKGAGAVSESLGNGALVLPAEAGPVLAAEALEMVLTDEQTRSQLVRAGFDRIDLVESQSHVSETVRLISELIG